MDNVITQNSIYVGLKDVADVLGKSLRTIQRYCVGNKYPTRLINGNGGEQYEILLSALEPEVQEKLRQKMFNEVFGKINALDNLSKDGLPRRYAPRNDGVAKPCEKYNFKISLCGGESMQNTKTNTLQAPPFSSKSCEDVILSEQQSLILKNYGLLDTDEKRIIPQDVRNKALKKVDLIMLWQNYRNKAKSKAIADKDFVSLFNNGKLCAKTHEALGDITLRTLYRWNKTYKESNNDFNSLIEGYNYGCESRLNTSLSDVEKYLLLKYMLNQNQFSLGRAYELIVRELEANGYQAKSLSVYRHVWEFVKRNYSDLVTFSRKGSKAFLDTEIPHILKDSTKLNVGDVITGDGHTLDFMVQDPNTGKPCRATLVGFIDNASRDLVGYDIMITENTQVIASALRSAIIRLGKMPKVVHLDNGRAFKGKTFTGHIDLAQAGIQGLYERLGIRTMFSKPYNSKGKGNVERFFEEFTQSLAKMLPSYIGNDIEHKPACTKRNEKFHKSIQRDFVPTIQQTKVLIDMWLENVYRKRKCLNDRSKTIKEYFDAGKGDGVELDLLDDLMRISEERQVKKGGIELFKAVYYSPALIGIKDKVVARYDMFNLDSVKVYSRRGEFICVAQRQKAIHPYANLLGTAKDVAEFKQKTKDIKKVEKERLTALKHTNKILAQNDEFAKLIEVKQDEILPITQANNNQKQDEYSYKINLAENQNIIDFEKNYTIDADKILRRY